MATSAGRREGSTAYVVLLTLVAALGGLLFGYDTAVISGAIGFLQEHFRLDPRFWRPAGRRPAHCWAVRWGPVWPAC